MLTPKQIKIFGGFFKKPYKELTYKEIKDHSNEKSNSLVQKAVAKFLSEDLIKKRQIGNSLLYKLNLENNIVFSYFDILLKEKLSQPIKRSIQRIKEEIKDVEFVSIIIFGSYAEGKQTEKSDLDIAIFVRTEDDKKRCEIAMKSAELKSMLSLDVQVITKEEMLQMLKDKQENLGKQIVHNHLPIHNPIIFYSILQEAIDNGFKIIYL